MEDIKRMKKKIIALLLALMMAVLLLAACGDNGPTPEDTQQQPPEQTQDTETPDDTDEIDDTDETEEPEEPEEPETPPARSGEPSRGVWNNDIYTNEYLGLRFVLPYSWFAASDAEMAELMGLGAEIMQSAGTSLPDELWDTIDTSLHEMMATSMFAGANVQILFERLGFPLGRISTEDYIEMAIEQLPLMLPGVRASAFPGTTRIGAYDWHSLGTALDIPEMGMTLYGRQFINVLDGFVRTIVITYSEFGESLETVLGMFAGLNDPLPARQGRSPALVGAWEWDMGETYVYIFNEDGTGTRGVPDVIEEFYWGVVGTDLFINLGFIIESWRYTIDGDVLTIDSNQRSGLTFSYIRQ